MAREPRLCSAVRRALREHDLLAGCRTLLVGVSGGPDSVALLLALVRIAGPWGPRLVVAHLHHGLRGRSADRDAEFTRRLSATLGLDAIVERVRLRAGRGLSLEAAARAARLEFFRRAAARCGADRVAVAHTADDQAETVLLRLLRGAGAEGLSVMAADGWVGDLRLIRPLLGVSRKDVLEFLRATGVRWRIDATNRNLRMARNRVRHRWLPWLEREFGPGVRAALCRSAEILAREDEELARRARRALARCRAPGGALRAAPLCRLSVAMARRVLREWIGGQIPSPSFSTVEKCRALIRRGRDGSEPLAGGLEAVRQRGRLWLRPRQTAQAPEWRPETLRVPGITRLVGTPWEIWAGWDRGWKPGGQAGPGQLPAVAWLDASTIAGGHLRARPWKAGDRYRPLGAPGRAKVGDIFTNLKVPLDRRAGWPVVTVGGRIVWLPGHRVAHDVRVSGPRSRSLRLELRTAL